MSIDQATLKSYLDQWHQYFEGTESDEKLRLRLRNFAFDGQLRSCNFRSVCWRIFLKCLSCDTGGWKDELGRIRQRYVQVKNKHVAKPSTEADAKDLSVDNPLSQSDQSSWNKYFRNSELKRTIERDVKRTFPEMEYFHNEKVHQLLVDILFCYAQENSDLSYRQGMHELLAPLLFIIHCDIQAACHAREIGQVMEIIDIVLDEEYLEHDAYDMFCHLMKSTNPWYSITEQVSSEELEEVAGNGVKPENATIQTLPFQPQEIATTGGPTLAITNKLNHIHNTLLVRHDLELHTHLNRLEIIPQVFGLRWIRLLFGREFSLQDLLVLWDATFADSATLDLVDYLFVAMLTNIRRQLLDADYSTCMQILMKYPPVDDINDIVQSAKEIRTLKGRSFSDSFKENATSSQSSNKTLKGERVSVLSSSLQGSLPKQNALSRMFKDLTRKVMPDNKTSFPVPSYLRDPTHAGQTKSPPQAKSLDVSSPRNVNGSTAYGKQIQHFMEAPKAEKMQRKHPVQLQEDVLKLHQELERMRQMCIFCSEKIDACVTVLQSSVSLAGDGEVASVFKEDPDSTVSTDSSPVAEQEKFEKEQVLVTVASLKQIRDLLKGTLTFNPNLREYRNKKEVRKPEDQLEAVEARQSTISTSAAAGDT